MRRASLSLAFALAACSERSEPTAPPPTTADAAVADAVSDAVVDTTEPIDTTVEEVAVDGGTYTNPVLPADFPDPYVLRVDKTYYAFATNGAGRNVQTARSFDLATWTTLDDALPALPAWAKSGASLTWAPSALARPGGYVLYYTARWDSAGVQCISRAVSAKPEGPYVDTSTAPFICQTDLCGSIDPSPYVEGDSLYLLFKSDENAPDCGTDARLFAQALTDDGLATKGEAVELLRRDQPWERPLIEGPSLLRHDGRYYLFYSANWWESTSYAMGYAVCDSPLGPCVKQSTGAPWVQAIDPVLGPGGQEVFTDPSGALWMAYHAWTAPIVGYGGGGRRSLRIDRLDFVGGAPLLRGPTTIPTAL